MMLLGLCFQHGSIPQLSFPWTAVGVSGVRSRVGPFADQPDTRKLTAQRLLRAAVGPIIFADTAGLHIAKFRNVFSSVAKLRTQCQERLRQTFDFMQSKGWGWKVEDKHSWPCFVKAPWSIMQSTARASWQELALPYYSMATDASCQFFVDRRVVLVKKERPDPERSTAECATASVVSSEKQLQASPRPNRSPNMASKREIKQEVRSCGSTPSKIAKVEQADSIEDVSSESEYEVLFKERVVPTLLSRAGRQQDVARQCLRLQEPMRVRVRTEKPTRLTAVFRAECTLCVGSGASEPITEIICRGPLSTSSIADV